jgi:NAD(P)-dependent dehydrogenase (short-subunit alcohol dehydrogenase family)
VSDLDNIFGLKGRIALVTGGAGWLGLPMVYGLCEAGAHVIIVGRNEKPISAMAAELISRKFSAESIALDLINPEETHSLIAYVEKTHGLLDILVNNASSNPLSPKGLDAVDASFTHAADINLTAVWRLTTSSRKLMQNAVSRSGDASVINIASMYGKVSPDPQVYVESNEPPNPACYGATKAGLIQLTRWLATNLGPMGIRVNSISPGPFPQIDTAARAPDFVKRLAGKTALGRVGERSEIKGPALFLASKASSFVTGTDISIDGGWTAY